MIICPGCGADMRFDPAEGKLKCDYCHKTLSISEYKQLSGDGSTAGELTADESELLSSVDPAAGRGDSVCESPAGPDSDNAFTDSGSSSSTGASGFEAILFTCPQCGAQLLTTDDTAATFCSYCGSSVALKRRLTKEKKPDRIIPFCISKAQCKSAYENRLQKDFFAPSELKEESRIERFRGIYMPYWIYSYTQRGDVLLKGTKTRTIMNYQYEDDYSLQVPGGFSFRDITYDASSMFYDDLTQGIAPYKVSESVAFDPAFLSGFYADNGDLENDVYEGEALSAAKNLAADRISTLTGAAAYGLTDDAIRDRLTLSRDSVQSAFFPVWFLSSRVKGRNGEDRITYAVVNGQTGKLAADLPVDIRKYLLTSLLLAIPLYILLNLFLTPTPARMLVFSLVFAVIGIRLACRQADSIYVREYRPEDLGLQQAARRRGELPKVSKRKPLLFKNQSENSREVSSMILVFVLFIGGYFLFDLFAESGVSTGLFSILAPLAFELGIPVFILISVLRSRIRRKNTSGKSRSPLLFRLGKCWRQLAGLLVMLAVTIWAPAFDLYYYLAAFASMLLTIWSFIGLIRDFNLLTTRKLPQMNKRGGDEYENR